MKFAYNYYSPKRNNGSYDVSVALGKLFGWYDCEYSIPIVGIFMNELAQECNKNPLIDDMLCSTVLPEDYNLVRKAILKATERTMIKYEHMYG